MTRTLRTPPTYAPGSPTADGFCYLGMLRLPVAGKLVTCVVPSCILLR